MAGRVFTQAKLGTMTGARMRLPCCLAVPLLLTMTLAQDVGHDAPGACRHGMA